MAIAKRKPLANRSPVFVPLRLALVGACTGFVLRRGLRAIFLPYGSARPLSVKPSFASIDHSNDLLTAKHGKLQKIFERVVEGEKPLVKGTETIFFDDHGTMYATTEQGKLITLTDMVTDESTGMTTVTATSIKDLGIGRPLAGKFWGDTLYIADSVLGLTRVQNVSNPRSKVEIVASTVMDQGKETRIHFADDVAIGPQSGKIYFTDASEIYPERLKDKTWDVLDASRLEALRGPSGRLLQYDPSTDEVTVLARELYFANGVAVAEDESYLVFVETFYSRVTKLYLHGEKRGTTERLIDGHPSPAWFDGVDCAWERHGAKSSLCYALGMTSVHPLAKLIYQLPTPIQRIFRTLLMIVPKTFSPRPKPYASIVLLDPSSPSTSGSYVGIVQDPTGKDLATMTGITFHQGKLYLGSIHRDYIGVYTVE